MNHKYPIKFTAKNAIVSPNSRCGNFMERHSSRIVLGESSETMQKLCVSTKFPHMKLGKITIFYPVVNVKS